jgi:rhomboid protease GluP
MSPTSAEPREQVLRWIADAAPAAWLPRVFAQAHRVNREALDTLLEELWLEGLIEKADAFAETGPGVALTDRGRRVLADPELLARLRGGLPLNEGDRGAIVRSALRCRATSWLTRVLIGINVAVFLVEQYLASQHRPRLVDRYMVVSAGNVIAGQWWRLLTSTFVHGGLMHLLFNMVALYTLGQDAEAMWGRGRYLVLYLVSAWVGSCTGVAQAPRGVVGASGAICGLLGAELVWTVLNRRYLPGALRRRAVSRNLINLVLVGAISLAPGISGWGHLGGLVAGSSAALLLHLQRFGPALLRWPALAAVALVPLAGMLYLRHVEATDPKWLELRDEAFRAGSLARAKGELNRATNSYNEEARPLLERHPTRRDNRAVEAVRPRLNHWQGRLEALADELEAAGPQPYPKTEKARQSAYDYASAFARLYAAVDRALGAGDQWTSREERELRQQTHKVEEFRATWLDLLED